MLGNVMLFVLNTFSPCCCVEQAKNVTKFTMIWNSQGAQSQAHVSIWTPSIMYHMSSNKVFICLTTFPLHMAATIILTVDDAYQACVCLGYVASKGFGTPTTNCAGVKYQMIEVTDSATLRMRRSRVLSSVIESVFPFPLRFKQVWHLARGGKSLYGKCQFV